MKKILITTVPFGEKDQTPIMLLEEAGLEYVINPFGRKITELELEGIIGEFNGLIAGTETISQKVLEKATNLEFISRVGIGLDGVDLSNAEKRGIQVSYTPDAPAPAVAELTVGLMLALLRHTHIANGNMHNGRWLRYFGRRVSEVTVGIIGLGRIGVGVIDRLSGFGPRKILVNDINTARCRNFSSRTHVEFATKNEIYKNADLISLHVPMTAETRNMICYDHLMMMKKDALVVNTSRGGIINEEDLTAVLESGHLAGVAVDVFSQEPYRGPLGNIERCLLTCHMGSMSIDCRTRMEVEATEEVVRFFSNQPLKSLVPKSEYDLQRYKD